MYNLTKLTLSLILILLIILVSSIAAVKANLIIYGDPADGVVTSGGGINSSNGAFWLGDEASPPNAILRSFVKFGLAEVSGTLGSATLKLYLELGERDAVGDFTSPIQNIGLGDTLVVHIDDFGTLDPSDFNAASIGNDPSVFISSTTNPNRGYISIDVTSAIQDDIDNGRAFTSFMIKMSIDTDGDGQVDRWFFSATERSGIDQDPIIEYELPPVGGIVTPINKLAIIAPYLVLAGLIIAVSAIVIKKRK